MQPPEVFCKKDVLINFTKFTGKHLCQSLFFHKVGGLRPGTLLKKRIWHRCFPVNFRKFIRTLSLKNTSGGGCFWKPSFVLTYPPLNSRLQKLFCQQFCQATEASVQNCNFIKRDSDTGVFL